MNTLETKVSTLRMTCRAANCLANACSGYYGEHLFAKSYEELTISDLIKVSQYDLLRKIRNFGRKTLQDVEKAILPFEFEIKLQPLVGPSPIDPRIRKWFEGKSRGLKNEIMREVREMMTQQMGVLLKMDLTNAPFEIRRAK